MSKINREDILHYLSQKDQIKRMRDDNTLLELEIFQAQKPIIRRFEDRADGLFIELHKVADRDFKHKNDPEGHFFFPIVVKDTYDWYHEEMLVPESILYGEDKEKIKFTDEWLRSRGLLKPPRKLLRVQAAIKLLSDVGFTVTKEK